MYECNSEILRMIDQRVKDRKMNNDQIMENGHWMAALAAHYQKTRRRYPADPLLILFDIDGTILDMRHIVLHLLKAYDQAHGSDLFVELDIGQIAVHEDHITPLLAQLRVPPEDQAKILEWYRARLWSTAPAMILQAHRPFGGVLEVIRWFQMQPNTYVGLNTARWEYLRQDTLRALNQLGHEFRVAFRDDLLYMYPENWPGSVPEAKAAGVQHFQDAGYRVFAFVDNEPENLEIITGLDPGHEILLLHADTIFKSRRTQLPKRAVNGSVYELADLIHETDLPKHIQFVWYAVQGSGNLERFLSANVHWGEFDLRSVGPQPFPGEPGLRTGPEADPWGVLDRALARIRQGNKGIKLQLRNDSATLARTLGLLGSRDFPDADLWFSASVDCWEKPWFQRLAAAYPDAIRQCPIDFLAPLLHSAPSKALDVLRSFESWGVNRFSLSWHTRGLRRFLGQLDEWGFDVEICNVPDLESFLRAVTLSPRAITFDFSDPQWRSTSSGERDGGDAFRFHLPKSAPALAMES
jgi:hypothetical protein